MNMLGKFASLTLCLGLVTGLAACQSTTPSIQASETFNLSFEQQKVVLPHTPKNIAVYDLAALDTLHALQVPAQIVPTSSYTGFLSAYAQPDVIKAGSLFEPDLAVLAEKKPDLIIVGGRSASQVEKLSPIAPVINFSANDEGDPIQNLSMRSTQLAAAFNKTQRAEAELAKIKQLQATLKQQTQGKSALMLFAVKDNFMPHAENERFGFVYALAGLKPTLSPAELSSAPRPEAGSLEAKALQEKNALRLKQAIEQQPDYLIVLDRGAVNNTVYETKETILKHPVLSTSKAVKEQRVIFVDANQWYLIGFGLHNTQAMLQGLIDATK